MNTDRALDDESAALQAEIDQLAEKLGVRTIPVGLRTNDGLNIYVADDGSYHFAFYERGKLIFDRVGGLDDLLYWYTEDVVTSQAAKRVGDRAERFKYEYQVLSHFNADWARRNVRETAALFRRYGQSEDISLLPDIGEAL
jgi:GT2 family glycosyltransferase